MEKIHNFIALEQIIYEEQRKFRDNVGPSRFVQIKRHQGEEYFYYDCLLADIVILNRHNVSRWKTHQLMTQEFPFSSSSNVNDTNKPKFQKKEWYLAVENANSIVMFLERQILFNKKLDTTLLTDLSICIENIKSYFGLHKLGATVSNSPVEMPAINAPLNTHATPTIQRHNLQYIEKLIYEENGDFKQNLGSLRFVEAKFDGEGCYFYYDCLLATVILSSRNKINSWNLQKLPENNLPFYLDSSVKNWDFTKQVKKDKQILQSKEWQRAVTNSEYICYFLKKKLSDTSLDNSLLKDIEKCINNIEQYFKKGQYDMDDNFTSSNLINEQSFIVNDNFFQTLSSPSLFQELNFGDKHTNKVYLLLEKIFSNFSILSKYKMQHVYQQVSKIDQYLVNHMKNIYLSQDFPMIDIQEETLSILNKMNTYLTQEIDKYLEQCIDNQLSLIDSIHNKFTKVNQV